MGTMHGNELFMIILIQNIFFYLTGFFNIGPIVMDERSLPWFGYIGPDNQAIKNSSLK